MSRSKIRHAHLFTASYCFCFWWITNNKHSFRNTFSIIAIALAIAAAHSLCSISITYKHFYSPQLLLLIDNVCFFLHLCCGFITAAEKFLLFIQIKRHILINNTLHVLYACHCHLPITSSCPLFVNVNPELNSRRYFVSYKTTFSFLK